MFSKIHSVLGIGKLGMFFALQGKILGKEKENENEKNVMLVLTMDL